VGLSGKFTARLQQRLTKIKKIKRDIDQEIALYAAALALYLEQTG
jgi:hypothetical protein